MEAAMLGCHLAGSVSEAPWRVSQDGAEPSAIGGGEEVFAVVTLKVAPSAQFHKNVYKLVDMHAIGESGRASRVGGAIG